MDTHNPPSAKTPLNQRKRFWLIILGLAVLFIGYQLWQANTNRHQRDENINPVVTAIATTATVPVYLNALGSVIPTHTVTVRTQINGILTQVLFREGQNVKAGEQIAQIDPRPYQAQLLEYEGQLMRDQALLDNAMIDVKRYQKLYKQDSIAQQTVTTQTALVKQYQGTVQIDKGLIEATKVNLIYTQITSPVDGRVGLRLVDQGNYVQTSDANGIAVINTLNPITVIFTIAEDNIQEILGKIYAQENIVVEAYDRQQNKLLATGKLITIDNQIDSTTGTVKLRAEFNNDDNLLFPSQFVNVKLLVKTLQDAIVIPTAAIQFFEKASFVYVVVDKDNKKIVHLQPVTTSVNIDGKTVIIKGVMPGQLVVTEGADNLTDGASVTLRQGQPKA